MKMGFFRTSVVKVYSKELKHMIDTLSKLNIEQIGRILVMAVWDRATLNMEGNLSVIKNKDGKIDPELHAYPILLMEIERWISRLKKKGLEGRAFCYSIWVHTLRSIIKPELSKLANSMWDILMKSKPSWENILAELRNEDIQRGISSDEVLITETHSRAILNCLPPKQLLDERSQQ